MRAGILILVTVIGGGCSVDVDPSAVAVLEGVVLDVDHNPLAGAVLETTGRRYPCEDAQGREEAAGGRALADENGWFRMRLSSFLGSAGTSCVDVVVTPISRTASDTIRAITVVFFDGGGVADTTRTMLKTGL